MRRMDVHGFRFEPPRGYELEESTIAWRLKTTQPLSASLIVQSKKGRLGATIEELAAEAILDLNQSLGSGMKNMMKAEFAFDDGSSGVLVGYDLFAKTGNFRQYFALRLHRERLCTITVTVPSAGFDQQSATEILSAIASLSLVSPS
jgi:hypothetical protein